MKHGAVRRLIGGEMHALLLCDDADETAILALLLQRAGLVVISGRDLGRLLPRWAEQQPSLALLAPHVGPLDAMVERIRAAAEAPIAVIANTQDEEALCRLYEVGADAVVQRPYSARLLLMQLRTLVRRSQSLTSPLLPKLTVGDLCLDPATRSVQVQDRAARHLTQLEFRLLYTLMVHQGQTLPTPTIVERVWGYDGEGSSQLVRQVVSRLRAKIEEDPRNPQTIVTVPGVGYLLVAE
jgi:DNA-binding response OmpR family regulator